MVISFDIYLQNRIVSDYFYGYTLDKSPLLSGWIDPYTGLKYNDRNIACRIMCQDRRDTLYFLDMFKILKSIFDQKEIMMCSILVIIF